MQDGILLAELKLAWQGSGSIMAHIACPPALKESLHESTCL